MLAMRFCDGEWVFELIRQISNWHQEDRNAYKDSYANMLGYVTLELSQLPADSECLLGFYNSRGLWDIARRHHLRKITTSPTLRELGYDIDEQTIKEKYHENRDKVLFGVNLHYLDNSVYIPLSRSELVRLTGWDNGLSCVDVCDSPTLLKRYWHVYDNINWQGRQADFHFVIETKNVIGNFTPSHKKERGSENNLLELFDQSYKTEAAEKVEQSP